MFKNIYRFLAVLSILSLLLAGASAPANAAPWRDKVDPWVLQTADLGETEFLVSLTTQADLSDAKALPTKLEKGTYVYQTLTATAARTQKGIIAQLDQLGVEYRSYWITNVIWVRAGLSTIQLLAARSDVAHLYANPTVKLDAPEVSITPGAAPQTIEWNILKVNADKVWDLGFTGQGTVIGGQDTGYQWDHPALINQYRGWNGSEADHNYNWHDAIHVDNNDCPGDSPEPCDDYGHGTHTMGTMVGDDGGGNQIGMAPGARWIGCRNMNDGAGTPSSYIECYEWFVAPTDLNGENPRPDLAPDVINNSWGCPPSEGCTDPDVLLEAVQNLVAAGIVSAHSAGNAGSGCSTVEDPAAIYDESFTVGATDRNDNLASFSSRGPVTIDGSGRLKPDISAPGDDIRSSIPGGGYQGGWSGTSMAGPHVAGEVALLISADPDLKGQVDLIEATIDQSAKHISSNLCSSDGVPNNLYGWGRIDALAAVNLVPTLALKKVASEETVLPGGLITYTLTVTHATGVEPTTNVVLTDTLPSGTSFVSASAPYTQEGSTIRWDFASLDQMEAVSVTLAVSVDITATGSITNSDYAVLSDQIDRVQGDPVTTPIENLEILQLAKLASAPSVFPGDLITYTLAITNSDELITIHNIVLTDTLPLKTTFVSATPPYTQDGDIFRWEVASLEAQATQSVQLVVKVNPDAFGTVTNADYAVRGDQAQPVRGIPLSTSLEKLDILQLEKTASVSYVYPGDLITYTLTITNADDLLDATNLVVTDTLPAGSSLVSTSSPYTMDGNVIRWDVPSLPAQGTLTVVLVVKIDQSASGTVTNADYGAYSDQAAFVSSSPVSTVVGKLFYLPITIKTP